MKRKDYQKPTVKVVKLQQRHQLLTGSTYESTGTRINAMDEDEDL